MRPRLLLAAVVLAAAPLARAQVELNVISGVDVKDEGAEVVVSIRGTKPPNFTTFSMADPPRFVIDLSESRFDRVPEDIVVPGGLIEVVKNLSYGSDATSIARVMIAFTVEVDPPDVQTVGDTLIVKIARPGGMAVAQASSSGQDAAARAEAKAKAEIAALQAEAERKSREDAEMRARQEREASARESRQAASGSSKATAAASGAGAAAGGAAVGGAAVAAGGKEADARAREAEARAEAEAQARAAEAQRKADAQREAESRAEAEAQARAAEAQRKANAQREAEARAEAEAQAREDADRQARADAEARADSQRRADAERDAQARADAEGRAEAEARTRADGAQARAEEEARAQAQRRDEPDRPEPERMAAAEPTPADDRLEARAPAAQLREIGFKQLPGVSRVFVRTSVTPRFNIQDVGQDTIRIEFENTRVVRRNDTRFLDTSFFSSAVAMITPSKRGTTYVVDIKLRERVPYQQRIEGDMLAIDFERPAAGAAAPSPAAGPDLQSGAAPGESAAPEDAKPE
jgi:hypothetical protein